MIDHDVGPEREPDRRLVVGERGETFTAPRVESGTAVKRFERRLVNEAQLARLVEKARMALSSHTMSNAEM